MLVVGVDACKTGWVAVVWADGMEPQAHYLPMIGTVEALATGADAITIDIPIGLPTEGVRAADREARKFVGARRKSVFLTPVREVLEAETYALANLAARARRAAVDDMLDAAVAAWSAARIVRGEARSLPDPPEVDLSGRRVAIWA